MGHRALVMFFRKRFYFSEMYTEIYWIRIIHGFHLCKFAYELKFICIPQNNTHSAFTVIQGHEQRGENFESPNTHGPI